MREAKGFPRKTKKKEGFFSQMLVEEREKEVNAENELFFRGEGGREKRMRKWRFEGG